MKGFLLSIFVFFTVVAAGKYMFLFYYFPNLGVPLRSLKPAKHLASCVKTAWPCVPYDCFYLELTSVLIETRCHTNYDFISLY